MVDLDVYLDRFHLWPTRSGVEASGTLKPGVTLEAVLQVVHSNIETLLQEEESWT